MSTFKIVSIIVLAFIVSLLANIPARHVYPYIESALPRTFLYQIEGSLWSGKAQNASVYGIPMQELSWNFKLWPLLMGRLETSMSGKNSDGYIKGNVGYSITKVVYLRNIEARLNILQVAPLVNSSLSYLDGNLVLNNFYLKMSENEIYDAAGVIKWQNAQLTIPAPIKLGDFKISVEKKDSKINALIKDEGQGPMVADGVFNLKNDGSYSLSSVFYERNPGGGLMQQLALFGSPGPDGKFKVTNQGKLASLLK